ncbi:hypothetical protein [Candidatus Nitrospira salsa]
MKDLFSRFPNTTAFIGGICLCISFSIFIEMILWQILGPYDDRGLIRSEPNGYHSRDATGSARPSGIGSIRSSLFWEDRQQFIYDVTYTIDEHSRRVTPFAASTKLDKFIMFFGGSFTYGEGVKDNQTLPYYTGVAVKKLRPYNYGFHGLGAAEMLAKLESEKLPREVSERKGVLVYVYMDDHIRRTIGSMRLVATWGKHKPYYYLSSGGELKRQGNFVTGRWFLTNLYLLLHESRILRALRIDFPLQINRQHIVLLCRIIKQSQSLFHKQFPNSRFYVLIWPGSKYSEQLKQLMAENKINYFDYTGLLNASDPKYVIAPPVEWHPTSLAYQTVATALAEDLSLINENEKNPELSEAR